LIIFLIFSVIAIFVRIDVAAATVALSRVVIIFFIILAGAVATRIFPI